MASEGTKGSWGLTETLGVVGITAALLYGAGYLTKTIALSKLGVGPISVSKESAMLAAFGLLIWLLPSIATAFIWVYMRRYVLALSFMRRITLGFGIVVVGLLLEGTLAWTTYTSLLDAKQFDAYPAITTVKVVAGFVIGGLLMWLRTERQGEFRLLAYCGTVSMFAVMLLAGIQIFAANCLTSWHPEFGGFYQVPVQVRSEKGFVEGVLLVSDDKQLVVEVNEQNGPNRKQSIPWSQIVEIRYGH